MSTAQPSFRERARQRAEQNKANLKATWAAKPTPTLASAVPARVVDSDRATRQATTLYRLMSFWLGLQILVVLLPLLAVAAVVAVIIGLFLFT